MTINLADKFLYTGPDALQKATSDAQRFSGMNCNNSKPQFIIKTGEDCYSVAATLSMDAVPEAICINGVIFQPA